MPKGYIHCMETPSTLQEAIQHFTDFENCRQFMIAVRWPNGVVRCPQCNSEKVTYLKNARLYKCYGDHKKTKFSLKVGTVFEDSPIALEKWLPAVWLVVNCKNGISSWELHRALGVTQKSAWFMLHRIRLAMQCGSFVKLGGEGGIVEVDETYIGGKARNMHAKDRRRRNVKDIGAKAMVMGAIERGGKVYAKVVPNRRKETIKEMIFPAIEKGTVVHTDEFPAYVYAAKDSEFEHKVINHLEKYVDGNIHTNGIENFWSLLKRGLGGTYIAVEPFHLFRYVDEQAFRFNNRATKDNPLNDADRFHLALSQIVGKRLTYAGLTGKTKEQPF
jgi:transposase-like protein